MRLAFLCSSLEPGKDGVGDYTRRLAGELIRQGHPSVAVALHDPHLSKPVVEQQPVEGTAVTVLRLPSQLPWSQRTIEAHAWLDTFAPDWISLQFVPFGFHPKGLCFGLGKSLAGMNQTAAWQIMFHELWLGLGEQSSVKHRVWGALQRNIVRDLIGRLHPRIVHTQAEPYRKVLRRENINAAILPLFGNIPRAIGDGWGTLLEPLVAAAAGTPQTRSSVYLAGVFGAVHPEWKVEHAVHTVLPLVERSEKTLGLVFFGKSGLDDEALEKIKTRFKDRVLVVALGPRTDSEISIILQSLDLGLATTPRQMIQKSGTVAAMLDHGLPVLVTRNDWRLRGSDFQPEESSSQLLSPEQFALLNNLPACKLPKSEKRGVNQIAKQFVEAISLQPI
jgi:hypothetical protein